MFMKNKRNIAIIILIALLVLFLIYNIFWFVTVYCNYSKYTKDMTKDDLGDYCTTKNGYTYYAYAPRYLSHTFNLTISSDKKNSNEVTCSLFIWPLAKEEERYGVLIENTNNDKKQFEIYVKEDLSPVYTINNKEKILLKQNHKTLLSMMNNYINMVQ